MTERTLAEQTTEQIAMPVNATGGRFMLNGRTYEGGAAHGYDGFEFYVHGRAGAMALLGEPLSAELITVEFGPFYPPFIKQMWESGEAKHSPRLPRSSLLNRVTCGRNTTCHHRPTGSRSSRSPNRFSHRRRGNKLLRLPMTLDQM